jgi:hypothetical protein
VAVARMQPLPTCETRPVDSQRRAKKLDSGNPSLPSPTEDSLRPLSGLLTFHKPTLQLSVEPGADVIRTMFVAWTKLARWSGRTACWLKVAKVRHAFSFCTVFLA